MEDRELNTEELEQVTGGVSVKESRDLKRKYNKEIQDYLDERKKKNMQILNCRLLFAPIRNF